MRENELYHFGIPGMKWGVRRYQNEDGTLTDAGRKRYYKKNRSKFYNVADHYRREYRTTPEGRRREYAYGKAEDKTTNALYDLEFNGTISEDDFRKIEDDYHEKEKAYWRGEQEYAVNKLLRDYGEENFAILVTEGRRTSMSGKEIAEKLIDTYATYKFQGHTMWIDDWDHLNGTA